MNIKIKLAFVAAVGLFVACTQPNRQSTLANQETLSAPDTTMVSMRGNALPILGHQPMVGEVAPDFTAVRVDMSDLTLNSLKGTRVVLNIFPASTPVSVLRVCVHSMSVPLSSKIPSSSVCPRICPLHKVASVEPKG